MKLGCIAGSVPLLRNCLKGQGRESVGLFVAPFSGVDVVVGPDDDPAVPDYVFVPLQAGER